MAKLIDFAVTLSCVATLGAYIGMNTPDFWLWVISDLKDGYRENPVHMHYRPGWQEMPRYLPKEKERD